MNDYEVRYLDYLREKLAESNRKLHYWMQVRKTDGYGNPAYTSSNKQVAICVNRVASIKRDITELEAQS